MNQIIKVEKGLKKKTNEIHKPPRIQHCQPLRTAEPTGKRAMSKASFPQRVWRIGLYVTHSALVFGRFRVEGVFECLGRKVKRGGNGKVRVRGEKQRIVGG